jgi:hypothetical protein
MEGYRGMTDTTTGKNLIATKVYDTGCEICKHMSKHDRATFEGFEEILYQEVKLDDIISHGNNLTKLRIYQCLERYAVNPDYTIDLPVYVMLSKQGQYKGHHVGAATIVELREKIKECLEDTPE